MYIPKEFENNDLDQLHDLIQTYNFATIISNDKNSHEIIVSHIPVMLDTSSGKYGTLFWHMSKQNNHASVLNEESNTLCVFHGPHSYISPHWYESKVNVPTWNYVSVHAHGIPIKISEKDLSNDLDRFVSHHESITRMSKPYMVNDDYKEKLLKGITGFRMEIIKLEGKFKLGQNRSLNDQDSMMLNLKNNHSTELANYIQKQLKE